MKLEIKHLASYLPYDLKVVFEADEHEHTLVGLVNWSDEIMVLSPFNDYGRSNIKNCKPILRPLSNLPKQNGDDDNYNYLGIVNFAHAFSLDGKKVGVFAMPYFFIEELCKEHYDVFGLIEKGLAIDINGIF